ARLVGRGDWGAREVPRGIRILPYSDSARQAMQCFSRTRHNEIAPFVFSRRTQTLEKGVIECRAGPIGGSPREIWERTPDAQTPKNSSKKGPSTGSTTNWGGKGVPRGGAP